MKLIVISSCHNEEKTIGEVLDRVPKKIPGITSIDKVVVDDGSTDNTVEVARKHGATVIQNGQRKRVAYCFQVAVEYALEHGADIAVNIDGDNQFDATEIPLLVEPILKGEADFAAADRFTDAKTGKFRRLENMPVSKYIGNLLGAWIVGKMSGQKFADVTCGFRAYNRKALLHININNKFTYTQETFQVMAAKNLNIKSIPVTVRYFQGRKSRVVENIPVYVFKSALNIIKAFRDYSPFKFFGWLGAVPFVPGFFCLLFVGIHYINTQSFSPYKFVGGIGVYLVSLGLLSWLIGAFADILNRVLHNQEKIMYYAKSIYFDKKRKE
ncbi:glycosyltransferase family 2 protein [bacterium]|nr:glycosyltransferase family 2 protein [bacterium]